MQRNMELVRSILLALEAVPPGDASLQQHLEIDGYSAEEVGFHAALMDEAGLIHAMNVRHHGQVQPFSVPLSITWEGYEFLAAAKNDGTWKTGVAVVKAKAGAIGFELLKAFLMAELKKQIGLGA